MALLGAARAPVRDLSVVHSGAVPSGLSGQLHGQFLQNGELVSTGLGPLQLVHS